MRRKGPRTWLQAYLIRVHFELADDLDSDLVPSLGISCFIDVAECPVAHFLYQDESFEPRVSRHLAGLFSLFGNNGFDVGMVDSLIFACSVGCGAPCLCSDISIVPSGNGILARLRLHILRELSMVLA